MAKRVRFDHGRAKCDPQRVFNVIRARVGELLQAPDLQVARVSQLELAIGTFAPSWILKGARISDYPFVEGRYVSLTDGHVYMVHGGMHDREAVLAYRLGFWRSCFTHRGGEAVALTAEGWLAHVMHVYSLNHASFQIDGGAIDHIDGERTTRRAYPGRKFHAYLRYLADTSWLCQQGRTLWARCRRRDTQTASALGSGAV